MKNFFLKTNVVIVWASLFALFITYLAIRVFLLIYPDYEPQMPEYNPPANREEYKKMKPQNLRYKPIVEEKKMKNLKMIGYVDDIGVRGKTQEQRLQGMILRVIRFQDITSKVEHKYGLPENILLAMIMQESGGADLLPNSSDDGGLGLCHMQPLLAHNFGLKTYKNCKELVSFEHGKELRELIKKYNYDRKSLIRFDDRFHPILNIDAAGRMLAYYMAGKQIKNTRLRTAILGYAGSKNYNKYYKNVMYFLRKINDKKLIQKVEKEFNRKNPNLLIGGEKADFDDYIEAHKQQDINYGLDKYN